MRAILAQTGVRRTGRRRSADAAADYFAHYWVNNLIHDYEVDWRHRPMAEVFDAGFAAIGERSRAFDLTLRYAQGRAMVKYPGPHPFDVLSVPVLHSVGWFDNILPYSMDDYTALCASPEKAHLQYLVADSTDHENYQLQFAPITFEHDHDANDQALTELIPIYLGPSLEFFDVFLKEKTDARGLSRVAWHLGHEGWHRASAWPPPETLELRLYLAAASRALAGAEGGSLVRAPEASAETARWQHDPEHLVPSTVANPFAFLHEFPDERGVECRDDVLTFTSEPMAEDLDLVGPVSAFLRVGSNAPSMHVFVKLCDVEPDGSARMLLRGQVLVRRPDADNLVEVRLSHTGYRVRAGHRLRLHVACSDFPLYLWYPGTDENPWFATETKPNEQILVTGGERDSYLSLTVMPAVAR